MPIFTRGKFSTKVRQVGVILCAVQMFVSMAQASWTVDLSRRTKNFRDSDMNQAEPDGRNPASYRTGHGGSPTWTPDAQVVTDVAEKSPNKGIFDTIFESGEPVQEIVILNTEKGFIPSSVRVRKNGRYKVHVVNVNDKEKNVSFILDGFSEHHATFYGKLKTFTLEPKKEGVFSFQSPETSAEGRLIVFNPEISIRHPASSDLSQERSK